MTDPASLRRAIQTLHDTYHVPHVVISSIPLRPWLTELLPAHLCPPTADADYLACIASSRTDTAGTSAVYAKCFPCLPGYFSGVGDLFSALVLAHFDGASSEGAHNESPLSRAASQAVSQTHAILSLTHEASMALPEDERQVTDEELDTREPMRKIKRMRGRELRLIQGQGIIRGTQPIEYRRLEPWTDFWAA